MSKKNAQQNKPETETTSQSNPNREPSTKKEIIYVNKTNYLLNVVLFGLAILIGILIQHNSHILSPKQSSSLDHLDDQHLGDGKRPTRSTDQPAPFDMEAVYREMSEKLKKEILESMSKQNEVKSTENKPNEKQEALKQSFENKIVIDNEPVREESSEIRLAAKNNEPIVIDSKQIINNHESKEKNEKKKQREVEAAKREQTRHDKKNREDQQAAKVIFLFFTYYTS